MSEAVPDNFLGLPRELSQYETAQFAVLPIPYDATTSYSVGTRDGPRAIITASQQVELYDEHLEREVFGMGIRRSRREKARGVLNGVTTLDPVHSDARGPEHMVQAVYKAARRPVRDGKFLIGLGGEHSVTSGLVRAVREKHRGLSVLQIDAHADLRPEYQGSPWSHASVIRRIVDMKVPVVAVGIRNYSLEEAKFIRSAQASAPVRRGGPAAYRMFSARHVREAAEAPQHRPHQWLNVVPGADARPGGRRGPESPESRAWLGEVVGALSDEVYVTIDIDGFDPAYAPGTGTPEPGGLDWYQVTDLLEAVARSRRIVAADVVEIRPIPPNTVTEFLAAKLIYRLMGLIRGYAASA